MSSQAVLAIVSETFDGAVAEAGRRAGLRVRQERTASSGIAALEAGPYVAVIVSLGVDWMDLATIERLAGDERSGGVIVTAPTPSLELSVAVRRAGAAAFVSEPPDPARLAEELDRLTAASERVVLPLADDGSTAPALLGASPPMAEVFEVIARVAETDATVLVTGESGTGKELVAQAVHWASPRAAGSFVAVNCAAIPEHLLESELFGHERGAFTGAVATKVGRFERASGGTLFLDEIGDMSLVLQAKILRALEEREIERVGGDRSIRVDVRVVAATNRDLRTRIDDGAFREDLYYRLAVVEITLPPLRDRGTDLEALALHFAGEFSRRYDRPVTGITGEALARLRSHSWPGNVRELKNVMDRAVLMAQGTSIATSDLQMGDAAPRGSPRDDDHEGGYPPHLTLEDVERRHIRRVLEHTGGHVSEAARVLGIHRNTLTRKVRAHGLTEVR